MPFASLDSQQSVTCVAFTADDPLLITSGAADGLFKYRCGGAHASFGQASWRRSPEPVLALGFGGEAGGGAPAMASRRRCPGVTSARQYAGSLEELENGLKHARAERAERAERETAREGVLGRWTSVFT